MIYDKFPNWEIDVEKGTIYSLKRNKYIGTNGRYSQVGRFGIHRVIWECVNGEIPSGYDIHHIDHNKLNNSIYNLELVEHNKHISQHNTENKGKFKRNEVTKNKIREKLIGNKNSLGFKLTDEQKKLVAKRFAKQVMQFTLDGELVKIWESASEAGRNGFCMSSICACCRGEQKYHKGFIWKYA